MRTLCFAATLVALAPVARGQEPELGPRSFFPPNYTGETYVDLETLRDTDLWDDLQRRVVVRMALSEFRRRYGFALDDVGHLRSALLLARSDDTWSVHAVTTMIGDARIGLPSVKRLAALGPEGMPRRYADHIPAAAAAYTIGGHRVVQYGADAEDGGSPVDEPRLFVQPREGCLVTGGKRLLASVLEGDRAGGVPDSGLMAITAAVRTAPAYAAIKLRYDQSYLNAVAPIPFAWFTAEDPPTFLVAALQPRDDGSVPVTVRVRFAQGEHGATHFESRARAALTAARADPELGKLQLFRALEERLTFEHDETDLVMRVDLADRRLGLQVLLSSIMPWMALSAETAAPAPPRTIEVELAPDRGGARRRE